MNDKEQKRTPGGPVMSVVPQMLIDEHIRVTYRNSKKDTYEQYRTVLYRITDVLKKNDLPTDPNEIDRDVVSYLFDVEWNKHTVSYRKWLTHILSRYLTFYKNETIKDMDIKFGQDVRPNVDWLKEEQTAQLLLTPKSPLEDIVIHLELNMGLRSVEVIRLRVQDVHLEAQYIDVRGKGRGDGKWRTVPIPSGSVDVFRRWIEKRNDYIRNVKKVNPRFEPPNAFIISHRYKHSPIVTVYTEQGHSLDRSVIHVLRKRLGFHFSHHTLRRTFGRMLYHAKVEVPTISKLMGHDDIATTLKYLGVNMDDMSSAMKMLETYQNSITGRRVF